MNIWFLPWLAAITPSTPPYKKALCDPLPGVVYTYDPSSASSFLACCDAWMVTSSLYKLSKMNADISDLYDRHRDVFGEGWVYWIFDPLTATVALW